MKQLPDTSSKRKSPFGSLRPSCPAPVFRDRALACCGAVAGIGLTACCAVWRSAKTRICPAARRRPWRFRGVCCSQCPRARSRSHGRSSAAMSSRLSSGILVGLIIEDPMIASGVRCRAGDRGHVADAMPASARRRRGAVGRARRAGDRRQRLHVSARADRRERHRSRRARLAFSFVHAASLAACREPGPTNPHKTFDPPAAQRSGSTPAT